MEQYGAPSWNEEWLKKVGWVEFRKMCLSSSTLNCKDEKEISALYTFLTGRTVASKKRK